MDKYPKYPGQIMKEYTLRQTRFAMLDIICCQLVFLSKS